MERFEAWYGKKYEWECGRQRGKIGKHLQKYNGEYISDHARDSWETWQAAISVTLESK